MSYSAVSIRAMLSAIISTLEPIVLSSMIFQ